MTETLKPCPFCGDKAVLKEDLRWHGAFRVECSSCDATVWATGENNPASAIAHWNTRAAPPAGVVVVWVATDDRGDSWCCTASTPAEADGKGEWLPLEGPLTQPGTVRRYALVPIEAEQAKGSEYDRRIQDRHTYLRERDSDT